MALTCCELLSLLLSTEKTLDYISFLPRSPPAFLSEDSFLWGISSSRLSSSWRTSCHGLSREERKSTGLSWLQRPLERGRAQAVAAASSTGRTRAGGWRPCLVRGERGWRPTTPAMEGAPRAWWPSLAHASAAPGDAHGADLLLPSVAIPSLNDLLLHLRPNRRKSANLELDLGDDGAEMICSSASW